MQPEDFLDSITPEGLARYVAMNASTVQEAHHHHRDVESIRRATYQGHDIVVYTTYRIEVDGKPVTGHVDVSNNGRVHYHAVPNLTFASAISMVKTLIANFPDDFKDRVSATPTHHS